jgi:hypothetical protein
MIDFSHTTISPNLSIYLPTGTGANSWQTWQKPRGFTMCSMYAIGAGGGGGGGLGSDTSNGRVGGCGGGSGGLSRLTIPLFLLPDTLFIRVLPGGAGGITTSLGGSASAGSSGGESIVAIRPSVTSAFTLLNAFGGGGAGSISPAGQVVTFTRINAGSGYVVGNQIRLTGGNNNCIMQVATVTGTGVNTLTLVAAGAGYNSAQTYSTTIVSGFGSGCTVRVDSTTSTVGSAGAAASAASASSCPLSQLGAALFIGGNAGALGGSTSATTGASITQGTASQIYGGAGGGGATSTTTGAGGDISAVSVSSPFAVSPGGVAGTSTDRRAGGNGFSYTGVFPGKFYGGAGGGSRNSTTGGAGGNGSAPGTGGGGGGAGPNNLAGRGGDGGPGCVIIQCW